MSDFDNFPFLKFLIKIIIFFGQLLIFLIIFAIIVFAIVIVIYIPNSSPSGGLASFALFQLPWTFMIATNSEKITIKNILGIISIITAIVTFFSYSIIFFATFLPFISLNIIIIINRLRKSMNLEKTISNNISNGLVQINDAGKEKWVTPSEAYDFEIELAKKEDYKEYSQKIRDFGIEILEGEYGQIEVKNFVLEIYKPEWLYKKGDLNNLHNICLKNASGESKLLILSETSDTITKIDVLRIIKEFDKDDDNIVLYTNQIDYDALKIISNSVISLRFYLQPKHYDGPVSSSIENILKDELFFQKIISYLSKRYEDINKSKVIPRKSNLIDYEQLIDESTPFEFEQIVSSLFEKMGYVVENLPHVGDYGADIIAKKDKDIIAIQCKKYSYGNHVGSPEIQKTLGSMWKYNANKSIIITTSDFTVRAQEQANNAPIELWTINHLLKIEQDYQKKKNRKTKK